MGHSGRIGSVVAAGSALLTLAACGDAVPGKSAAVPLPAQDASAAPSSSSAGGSDEVTPPGTELKLGEKAVLPFEFSGRKGSIAVTVTAIDTGTEADAKEVLPHSNGGGTLPYFLRLTVENVSGEDLAGSTVRVDGVDADGLGGVVLVGGGVPGTCEAEPAPDDFTTEGASFETCSLTALAKPVVAAEYSEGDYSSNPVVWRK